MIERHRRRHGIEQHGIVRARRGGTRVARGIRRRVRQHARHHGAGPRHPRDRHGVRGPGPGHKRHERAPHRAARKAEVRPRKARHRLTEEHRESDRARGRRVRLPRRLIERHRRRHFVDRVHLPREVAVARPRPAQQIGPVRDRVVVHEIEPEGAVIGSRRRRHRVGRSRPRHRRERRACHAARH